MSIRTLALLAAFAIAGLQAGCATQAPAVTHLNSGKVLPTGLPFSEAVRVGDTVYLSGQIGNVPGPGPIKLAPGGMVAEARQTMDNIKTSLEAHGLSMADAETRPVRPVPVIRDDTGQAIVASKVRPTIEPPSDMSGLAATARDL